MSRTFNYRVLLSVGLLACGGSLPDAADGGDAHTEDAAPDAREDGVADTAPDGGPTRSFALASTGLQLLTGPGGGLQLTEADLASDVDVIAIHNDFYGIPWDEFATGSEPPEPWVAVMDALKESASSTGKDVFLSLSLLSAGMGRRGLEAKAVVEEGQLSKIERWSAECYDFATADDGDANREAFVRYVEWMIDEFAPVYLNVAIEMNLFMPCGDAWDALVDVERAAYDAAKARDPELLVFPSIQIDVLYGYSDDCSDSTTKNQCFEANYARLARLKRDRFAISTYPQLVEDLAGVVPDDWFSRAAEPGSEQIVVAETGWNATPIRGTWSDGSCITAIDSTPEVQLAYFELLLEAADTHQMDLVTWFSNRDLVVEEVATDCPCDFNADWCEIVDVFRQTGGSDPVLQFYAEMTLKIFGTMGLRTYDGTPREAFYASWTAARARDSGPSAD